MNAFDVLARLRLPDGRLWIDVAVDFQLADARAVLDPDGPPYAFLTRSRGASKTTDLGGLALALLLAADHPARFVWCASDTGQGQLAIDAVHAFARDSGLADRVEVQARRVRVPQSGARLDVLPADEPGAWGLNPDAVFVDELANWSDTPAPRRLWEAVAQRVLNPAREAIGMEWVSFHTFRHTCASLLFEAGRNVKQVQEWLGHADPSSTLRTYLHLMDAGVGDAAIFDQAVGKDPVGVDRSPRW